MPAFHPRIAIVGGGPAGLALGLLLSRKGIKATIYELRKKPTTDELAQPSGMLDLHEESGLTVMHECGLWDDFQAALGDCSEDMRVMNTDAELLHADQGQLSNRPEIARNALSDLLLQHMPENIVKWGHKINAVQSRRNEPTDAIEVELDLGDNGTATYDFVVGADGAWSKVRNLLSGVKPLYSGLHLVAATLRHTAKTYPHLVDLAGTGALIALGGHNGLMTHRGPQDSIRLYTVLTTPDEDWIGTNQLKSKTAAEIKTFLLSDDKLFKQWSPKLQDLLVTACDEETRDHSQQPAEIWPLYMLPVGHSWEHHPAATIIGDAAHLMTPFAGEGVNLALWDSLDLARVLYTVAEAEDAAAWQTALQPKLQEFEKMMQARAEEKAAETKRNQEMMFGDDGAQAIASMFSMYQDIAAPSEQRKE